MLMWGPQVHNFQLTWVSGPLRENTRKTYTGSLQREHTQVVLYIYAPKVPFFGKKHIIYHLNIFSCIIVLTICILLHNRPLYLAKLTSSSCKTETLDPLNNSLFLHPPKKYFFKCI